VVVVQFFKYIELGFENAGRLLADKSLRGILEMSEKFTALGLRSTFPIFSSLGYLLGDVGSSGLVSIVRDGFCWISPAEVCSAEVC